MPFKKKHNPMTCLVCLEKFTQAKVVKKTTRKVKDKKHALKQGKKNKKTIVKLKGRGAKKQVEVPKSGYLSFSNFVKKLKRRKQNVVEYPEEMDPKYIPVKDLFKKK